MSNIEWTDATWNPVVGCTPVSPGCLNCYAASMARRLEGMGRPEYMPQGDPRSISQIQRAENVGYVQATEIKQRRLPIVEVRNGRAVFTGQVRTLPERLTEPLHWWKPRRVFVNSMSDLFHESVPFDFIDKVFAVMALCPQHQFQVLTKRPERMAEYLSDRVDGGLKLAAAIRDLVGRSREDEFVSRTEEAVRRYDNADGVLPNVWLGTSVEDQARADERIPHLLKCPAAVRFLSCEPLVGPVDLKRYMAAASYRQMQAAFPCDESRVPAHLRYAGPSSPDWVIVGGESGAGARPCDVAWIRSIVQQCKASGVAVFVKQVGSRPLCGCGGDVAAWAKNHGERRAECSRCGVTFPPRDRKGGDPAEWPSDLRVREFPAERTS